MFTVLLSKEVLLLFVSAFVVIAVLCLCAFFFERKRKYKRPTRM
ncbi:MAG: hypothetical protein RSA86_03730 [Christensenellaceae bacterium]